MSRQSEHLQRVWHAYETEMGQLPATAREAAAWGVSQGLIQSPSVDPLDILAENMARALREEYRVDRLGRKYRVNHAVRVTKAGVQHTMWAILDHAPRPFMQKAFAQRRKQIVGDCVQLQTDVNVYNSLHIDQQAIQLVLNFTDDVSEAIGNDNNGQQAA